MSIGKNLKKTRLKAGLSQIELAEEIGVVQTIVSKYELDQLNPTVDTLIAICKILDITPDQLLGYSDKETIYEINKSIMKRAKAISALTNSDQNHILKSLDTLLNGVKSKYK